ncbi:amino acid ABC transporter permease [Liquorilactobacillus uvarum]|nr:amino acid ABC transporter permease [Liquorilactobacillus uvarum]
MFSSQVMHTLVPLLFEGLKITLLVAITGIAIGFIIGCLSGFALQSNNKFAKTISGVYVWVIRGTPVIVQALYVYFVLPKIFNFDLPSNIAGIIVIAINSGAFISEIVRGALMGVDPGQREAGLSLGMSNVHILVHLVIPPAFRSALPALGNQFIMSVKDTSLLTVIVVKEMTQQAMNYASINFDYVNTYSVLALFYLALLSILMLLQKYIENKFNLKK